MSITHDGRGGAETRTAFMLLGRRAIEDDGADDDLTDANLILGRTPRTRITVALLRKILVPSTADGTQPQPAQQTSTSSVEGKIGDSQKSQAEAAAQAADDDKFLQSNTVRLDSKNIKIIENLEVLEELTHLHLQNNLIQVVEELDFLRKLQWLDLSRCNITTVSGIAHLRELQHLDLSCNKITAIDGDLKTVFPRIALRVLNMYGNPLASTDGYRDQFTGAFPKLLAFDGTCLVDQPGDAPIPPGTEMYGCDGDGCRARVIFGPRFVKRRPKDGAEEDYCIACAHRAVTAFKEAEAGKLEGHGFVLQSSSAAAKKEVGEEEEAGAGFRMEKYQRTLGASARTARLSMRNTRERLIMKARARRQATAVDAEARMFDLGRESESAAASGAALKK
jgi:hypothetical protein